MNKNINLGIGILAIVILITYFTNSEDIDALGMHINIWVFRGIWLFIAVVQLLTYWRKLKQDA